jgi:outer membrane protein assembly factor BamB
MEGTALWQYDLQDQYGDFGLMWGYASSPLLHDGALYVEVLHGMHTDEPSYLIAFDAAKGAVLWRVERPTDAVGESPDAYTTPVVLEHGGQTQIVISGGDYITGHDPTTGKELWRAGGLNPGKEWNYRVIGSPIAINGMIYATSRRNPVLALRAGGTGDISRSHLAWKWEGAGAPDVPSAVSDGRYFYMADDRGRVTCLDAKTGETLWGPKRTGQGNVSASPVLADGKLYLINENAVTTVLAAGPEFKVLATNELDGGFTLSSPAIADGRIYLRTETHLYCIGRDEGEN